MPKNAARRSHVSITISTIIKLSDQFSWSLVDQSAPLLTVHPRLSWGAVVLCSKIATAIGVQPSTATRPQDKATEVVIRIIAVPAWRNTGGAALEDQTDLAARALADVESAARVVPPAVIRRHYLLLLCSGEAERGDLAGRESAAPGRSSRWKWTNSPPAKNSALSFPGSKNFAQSRRMEHAPHMQPKYFLFVFRKLWIAV